MAAPLATRDALPQSGRSVNTPPRETPLDVDQIKGLLEVMPDAGIASQVKKRGINFKIDEDLIGNPEEAGVGPETLAALRAFLSDRPPAVKLRADETTVASARLLPLTAEATDPDGDEIQYRWLTNAGRIVGEGRDVELDTSGIDIASGQLLVTVSVTVSDGKGGFASDSKVLTVRGAPANAAGSSEEGDDSSGESGGKMLLKSYVDGKYLIITLAGRSGSPPGPLGSIEVSLDVSGGSALVKSLTGFLPGVPCRVDLVGLTNLAEGSFADTPGVDNKWGKVIVRLRVKDPKRVVRFVIGWKVLNEAAAH